MTAVTPFKPGPPAHAAPQWVGDEDVRRDISNMTDREVAIMSLDVSLRMLVALRRHADAFLEFLKDRSDEKTILLKELPDHARRIVNLEQQRPYRDPESSYHEWDELLKHAGTELSRRVKDPKDHLDSDRAREIAKEVLDSTRIAEDAKHFRSWKSGAGKIVLEVLKYVAVAALGVLAHALLKGNL